MVGGFDSLYLFYVLCIMWSVCVSDNSRVHTSTLEHGRPYSSKKDHLDSIINNTSNGFTQHHPNDINSANSLSSADSKFLSMFAIVRFPNEMCTVGSTMGLCVTATECSDLGGTKIGDCARGYGTCCYKAIKCGESSSMNVTYIQNADYPGTTSSSGTCTHMIMRQDNVCKLRLDFVDFELSDPYRVDSDVKNGKCEDDQMTVTGQATPTLTYLCGKMPPTWHYYLDVHNAINPTTFNFALSSGVTKDRKWNIKVTQIDCDRKIPQGCGQYFTGTSGDPLYSFNWGNNGMYLYGMNYAICFRQEKGYCTHSFVDSGTSWVVCPDSLAFPSADLGNGQPVVAPPFPGDGADTLDCNFVILATSWPSPINTNNFSPTSIYHYTDQDNLGRYVAGIPVANQPADVNPGFHFTWTHNKC